MALQHCSRRQLLAAGIAAVASTAGCVSETPGTEPNSETPATDTADTPTTSTRADDVEVVDLSVSDFVLYPLSGTHPHVHRRAGTQYVVVRVASAADWEAVADALTLALDGDPAALAQRQPVSWDHDDVEVAFAVPKDWEVKQGELRFDGGTLRRLSDGTLSRLNNPPVFEVGSPAVSPAELEVGETVSATVTFTLSNDGAGAGTFGASLKGNYVSGANTVTATLEAGAEREVSAPVKLHGRGDEATVRLDWGADEWVAGVPVVGTETP
jgi:hypothetical protein